MNARSNSLARWPVLLLILLWHATGCAAEAGRIVLLQADQERAPCFFVRRAGAESTVTPDGLLEAGDQFLVRRKTCWAVLRVGDVYVDGINAERSPYPIKSQPIAGPRLTQLLRLDKVFAPFANSSISAVSAEGARGGALSWWLGDQPNGASTLATDQATYWFVWEGGNAPYNLSLIGADGNCPTAKALENAAQCQVPTQPGIYTAVLKDFGGQSLKGFVRVVPRKDHECEASRVAPVSEPAQATERALEIAKCGRSWRLEAAQALIPMQGTYTPARWLLAALLAGLI